MNLETKITIYKFTPQVFTLTPKNVTILIELRIISNPLILYKGIIYSIDKNPSHISGKQTDNSLPEF